LAQPCEPDANICAGKTRLVQTPVEPRDLASPGNAGRRVDAFTAAVRRCGQRIGLEALVTGAPERKNVPQAHLLGGPPAPAVGRRPRLVGRQPAACDAPRQILEPIRQSGTAALSVEGCAGSPSLVSSLNMNPATSSSLHRVWGRMDVASLCHCPRCGASGRFGHPGEGLRRVGSASVALALPT
jgi:hypothetical protein